MATVSKQECLRKFNRRLRKNKQKRLQRIMQEIRNKNKKKVKIKKNDCLWRTIDFMLVNSNLSLSYGSIA